jgi:hypothetical protein
MSSAFPALVGNLTLVDLLLLVAVLLVVPIGLRLLPLAGYRARQVLCVARIAQPAGAAAALVSFLIAPGYLAGVLSLGWLITCSVASLAGLIELLERRSIRPSALVPAAAVAYLSVGAGWLVVSRAGLRPLGFSRDIVELTGVHFHYAGFAATLIAALTLVALRDRGRLRHVASAAGLLVVAGVPITAAGIATGSGLLTFVGPILLASGVLSTAALMAMAVATRVESIAARWLLWISAAGVVAPILLGVEYALGRIFPLPTLDLRAMAFIHGDLNAVAFSLAGLVGWSLTLPYGKIWMTAPPPAEDPPDAIPVPRL